MWYFASLCGMLYFLPVKHIDSCILRRKALNDLWNSTRSFLRWLKENTECTFLFVKHHSVSLLSWRVHTCNCNWHIQKAFPMFYIFGIVDVVTLFCYLFVDFTKYSFVSLNPSTNYQINVAKYSTHAIRCLTGGIFFACYSAWRPTWNIKLFGKRW